ncbi:acyl-CoA dehydrogenase family protein [Xylophilus sp.]|uniref:acyl-CoA dehydrogenase family protein n=1 Tax=Xylophilus sp. TaxID=2653893 RepID=UPI0013BE4193|nr:acyl-CoA dehydrogenase family protein [Xylophilus sp.]KAF1042882.1 MAG: Dibenzothiophene desulfurization enzyme C [Xylophilus sp.]
MSHHPPFEPDLSDSVVARAAALRASLQADAAARDLAGGRPTAQITQLRAIGLLSTWLPTAYGGEGSSWLSVLRAVRELARADGAIAHLYGYHHLNLHSVRARATPAQRDRWFTDSARAQWLWANSGNTLSPTSTARRDGDAWVLDGFRPFSSGTHVADRIVVSWENAEGQRTSAVVPADRAGVVIADDWDGIGQRQTGSGTVRFEGVRIADDEVFLRPGAPLTPFASLIPQLQQSVLLNVFVGSAQGALDEGSAYTRAESRPWIHSGVERHVDDPWVQRKYGELAIRTLAATELADAAARSLDAAYAEGDALTPQQRGALAIEVAAANVYAGEAGLAVSEQVFEVTGARSATRARGYDRFWRNVRTHTLHNPAEYKKRSVGHWFLSGDFPEPGVYR